MRPSPQRPHCADASVPLPPTGLLRSVRKEQCPTGFLPEARIHPVSRPEGERRADLRHQERTARRPTRQRRATSRWLRCLRCSPSWSRPSTARPRRSERWPSRGSARCTRSPAGRHAEEETSPIAHRPSPIARPCPLRALHGGSLRSDPPRGSLRRRGGHTGSPAWRWPPRHADLFRAGGTTRFICPTLVRLCLHGSRPSCVSLSAHRRCTSTNELGRRGCRQRVRKVHAICCAPGLTAFWSLRFPAGSLKPLAITTR